MTDKNGQPAQCRDSVFSNTVLSGTGTCPFKGPDIAIVPMRYALDRSRYDVDPDRLTPLAASGKWARYPGLQTRNLTLRQLRDGFVYVYNDMDEVLHEYAFNARDASLTRIVWNDAEPGLDIRARKAESRTHLLYPRNSKLRIAFSPWQWTWRMCEQMRSSPANRASWMQPLDLRDYCRDMSVTHALPLARLSEKVVADVDPYPVDHDGRFADSANPPVVPEGAGYKPLPLAADVVWTGSVEDKSSAVLFALDDSLGMLEDLGMQLIADQAALFAFQAEHEHAMNIAGIVERLCGVGGDPALLPASVKGDEVKTRQYIRDIEAYFEELDAEDRAAAGTEGLILGVVELPSTTLGYELKSRYGRLPDPALRSSWQERSKWRREVDLDAARDFTEARQPQLNSLKQHITQTQDDIKAIGEHIGTDPMRLFIDTTNATSLHCLLDLTAELLCSLSQDVSFSRWLEKEEERSRTLFGLTRYGFSAPIKEAMTNEANRLMSGITDFTALAGRAGEINGFLNHDAIAAHPWIRVLSEPVQLTLQALTELAKGAGKTTLEQIQLAFIAVDSRMSDQAIALRNLTIGHLLFSHQDRLKIDQEFNERIAAWSKEAERLRNEKLVVEHHWSNPGGRYDRKRVAEVLVELNEHIEQHNLQRPHLLDYAQNRYLRRLQMEIAHFHKNSAQLAGNWQSHARAFTEQHGLNAGAITWGLVVVNFFNTMATYQLASKDGDLNAKDWAKIGSAAAYTGNALMAVFVETAWVGMKGLETVIDDDVVKITGRAARYWATSSGTTQSWGKLISGFGGRLLGLGGFMVVAAWLELWDIDDDLSRTDIALDQSFIAVKRATVLGMLVIGGAQAMAGVLSLAGYGFLIPWVMNPWFAAATVIVGLVYLFATYALNYLKRDMVGQWLHKCRWSRFPVERFQAEAEENQLFLRIQLSPAVFVKSTMETKFISTGPTGYSPREVPNGAWIQLRVPEVLRSKVILINLTASRRPGLLMPVEASGNSLKEYFIGYGTTESIADWGKTSDTKTQMRYNDPPYRPVPPEGEDVIWQTWVPVADNAQYLEIQIWYPASILPVKAADEGYLYQVELDADGRSEGNSSLDGNDSVLSVESLGGRKEAASIPLVG